MIEDIDERSAVLSDDGKYRYQLDRKWGPGEVMLTFVMLNPSTADANEDDPTIRRCVNFAKRELFHGIRVLNLYAYRTPSPAQLWLADDPIGPEIGRVTEIRQMYADLGDRPGLRVNVRPALFMMDQALERGKIAAGQDDVAAQVSALKELQGFKE